MKTKEPEQRVWCATCIDKRPPVIRMADYLIPTRKGYYDLTLDGSGVSKGLVGVCKQCLKGKNDFQKNNKQPVDINHKHLVYRSV